MVTSGTWHLILRNKEESQDVEQRVPKLKGTGEATGCHQQLQKSHTGDSTSRSPLGKASRKKIEQSRPGRSRQAWKPVEMRGALRDRNHQDTGLRRHRTVPEQGSKQWGRGAQEKQLGREEAEWGLAWVSPVTG